MAYVVHLKGMQPLNHSPFLQLNFNEAVNFAIPDWLPFGLACVERYREHRKLPVFSHDELLLTIAQHSTGIKTAIWLVLCLLFRGSS